MVKRLLLLFFGVLFLGISCQREGTSSKQKKISYKKNDSIVNVCRQLDKEGNRLRDISDYENALELHFKALRMCQKNNDTLGIIMAYNNIGTDLRRTFSNIKAAQYHFKALELCGEKKEFKQYKAFAVNGLGNIFLLNKELEEAESYFKTSLAISKELNNILGLAINYANIGEVKTAKKEYDEALRYYRKSLERNQVINSNIGKSICKKLIGEVLLLKNQPQKGLKLMRESISIIEDSPDSFHLLECKLGLCRELLKRNEYQEANTILKDVLKRADEIGSYKFLFESFELLTNLHKKQLNFKEALLAKEKALLYKGLLTKQNNEVKIIEIKNRFKTQQAIQQINFLKKEQELAEKTHRIQKRLFQLLSIVLLISIGLLYYTARKRKQINKQLKEINTVKSRFFGNISHEFRTPITLIQGPLEKIMMNNDLSEDVKSDIKMVRRNSQKLLSLVNQILSLSKIEAGRFEIKAIREDLSEFIRKIAQSFRFQTTDKKLKYQIELDDSKIVWFDPNIIEMIVSNLLSNAFKFTPKEGYIRFETHLKDNIYQLRISNNIKPNQRDNINHFFDRFYTEKMGKQGTGIGLSLVKELCKVYRIDVNVHTPTDNSIEFAIDFPINREHFKDYEIAPTKYKEIESTSTTEEDTIVNKEELLMLIAEDNTDMREYIKSIFESDYKVIEAVDGKQGIEKAKKHIPDIIISDVMMPKINGIALCDQLKKDELTDHIPIILLTALTNEEAVIKGLQNHADDYITKPFGINILKLKVANLIETRQKLQEKYKKEIIFNPISERLENESIAFTNVLRNILEDHIINPKFGIKEFCDITGMSRTQLHRKLNATTGMSATEFIRIHRLKIASELLKTSKKSISEVCYESGFNSVPYFTRQFKSFFKITPKAYKEAHSPMNIKNGQEKHLQSTTIENKIKNN